MKSPKEQRTAVFDAIKSAYTQGMRDGVHNEIGQGPSVALHLMESLTGHCTQDEAKSCYNCAETCKCECLGCTLAKTT